MLALVVALFFSFPTTNGLALSQTTPEMQVYPNNIVEGMTERMYIECTVNMKEKTFIAMLFTISVSHAKINDESNFTGIASLSSFEGFTTLDGDGTHTSGVINNTGLSYINITKEDPHIENAGLYRCEINGVNKMGKPLSILSKKKVIINSPTLAMAIREMNEMKHQSESMASENEELKNILGRLVLKTDVLKSKLLNETNTISYLKNTNGKIIENINNIAKNATKIKDRLDHILELSKTAFLFSSNSFNGRKYWLTRAITFFNPSFAEDVCELYGGYLAEIDTQAEFEFVKSFVSANANILYVITGGTDEDREGVWVNRHNKSPVAAFWANSEPNNRGGYENCQAFSRDNYWVMNDVNCYFLNRNDIGFVCEIPEKLTN